MVEEVSVEEFKKRYRRKPTLPRPDPHWSAFIRAICDWCIAHDFDIPTKEYRFLHPIREWRFDLCWPKLGVAFEREGGTWTDGRHVRGEGYRNDCCKYNQAALRGWLVIRATTDMLTDGTALKDITEALRIRSSELALGERTRVPPSRMAGG